MANHGVSGSSANASLPLPGWPARARQRPAGLARLRSSELLLLAYFSYASVRAWLAAPASPHWFWLVGLTLALGALLSALQRAERLGYQRFCSIVQPWRSTA